jgi:hypothetical protein
MNVAMKPITREEVKKLQGAAYTSNHNQNRGDFKEEIKRRLATRSIDTTDFEKMSIADYKDVDQSISGTLESGGRVAGLFDESDFADNNTRRRYQELMNARELEAQAYKREMDDKVRNARIDIPVAVGRNVVPALPVAGLDVRPLPLIGLQTRTGSKRSKNLPVGR